MSAIAEHIFTQTDGPQLRYATRSLGSTPISLVFIHGWPDSWRSFEPVMEALPSTVGAISISLRGFGGSEAPPTGFTPADMAQDVRKLVDQLGITSAVFIGHSLGSLVVQQLAAEPPRALAGLVLVGGFNRLGDDVFEEVWSAVEGLSDPLDEAFVRAFQSSTLAAPIPTHVFERIIAESMRAPARVWKAAFAGIRTMSRDSLSRISAPTLLLWGDRDGLVPRREQDALLAAIPGARLVVYEGSGHSPNWEQPARVARDIEDFAHQLGMMRA